MTIKRLLKHMTTTAYASRRIFPKQSAEKIESLISQSEHSHMGELRFVVETNLEPMQIIKGITGRERAIEVFSELHVWDTAQNTGVLLYLLLADRDIEIVADRGINERVAPVIWEGICQEMEVQFKRGAFLYGVEHGITRITELLQQHFPAERDNPDELCNKPVIR